MTALQQTTVQQTQGHGHQVQMDWAVMGELATAAGHPAFPFCGGGGAGGGSCGGGGSSSGGRRRRCGSCGCCRSSCKGLTCM